MYRAKPMLSESKLINKLNRFNVSAQKELYEKYAVSFKRMCLNYVTRHEDANDILQEGFMKIFKHIGQFKGEGSFEGWMKRIIINTALKHYRKEKQSKFQVNFDDVNESSIYHEDEIQDTIEFVDRKDFDESTIDYNVVLQANFSKSELLEAIDKLKDDFKIVFNLYFIDDYKHQEIAEMLGIDENTSRSRLSRARKFVQKEIYKKCIDRVTV